MTLLDRRREAEPRATLVADELFVDTVDVPQANDLGEVVRAVCRLPQFQGSAVHPRHRCFYLRAARILGLVDDDGPTYPGLLLRRSSRAQQRRLLRIAFAHSAVGAAWLRWAGASRLESLPAESAQPFLEACTDLASSTAARRASTLRAWLDFVRGEVA